LDARSLSRSVPEWQGSSPDAKIPDRVKLRIWIREGGRDYLTGALIRPGEQYEFEHEVALCNGGKHIESNIRLVKKGKAHQEKTARDLKQRVRNDKAVKRHAGIKKPSAFSTSRDGPYKQKMDGTLVWRDTGEPVNPRGSR
jgi:5-methylcytosine-specific restriction protein A